MNLERDQITELAGLMDALCEECITSEQIARLEELVLSSDACRRYYHEYIALHGTLYWDAAALADTGARTACVPSSVSSEPALAAPATPKRSRARFTAAIVGVSLTLVVLFAVALVNFEGWNGLWTAVTLDPAPGESPRPEDPASDPADPRKPLRPNVNLLGRDDPDPSPSPESPDVMPPEDEEDESVPIASFIDERIRSGWDEYEVAPSPRASDEEWIRRAYLDVVGHIPPAQEVERFRTSDAPDKRARLIEKLLDSESYSRNWATIWTNLLVGRSEKPGVDRSALERFLRRSFWENRGWDEIVADLIVAEGDPSENGAANFLVAHLNNQAVPATATTARLFLGMQVQCTQCHRHPYNDWTQKSFWNLNAFFKGTRTQNHIERDPRSQKVVRRWTELVSEPVEGPVYYENLKGVMSVAYPKLNEFSVDEKTPTKRREELARFLTYGPRPELADAIVNRVWAHFLGRPFTHDVDDMGPHATPSHPRLLARLSREFVRSGYDLKQLIRWVTRSEPYQLTSRFGGSNREDDPHRGSLDRVFSRVYVKPMSAEQVYDSILVATGLTSHDVKIDRTEWVRQFVADDETEENGELSTFDGTIAQAMAMMNGELVNAALNHRSADTLRSIIESRASEREKIRRLCLAALSRYPSKDELDAMRKFLRQAARHRPRGMSAKTAVANGLQDLFWACLNSNEFVVVH